MSKELRAAAERVANAAYICTGNVWVEHEKKWAVSPEDATNVANAYLAEHPADEPPKPLRGEWRHSNGIICCGSLRIAVADFDTQPSPEFVTEVFDWICKTMNRSYSSKR